MEKNIKPTFIQLKGVLAVCLLFCVFVMTGCSKEEDPAPKDSQEEINRAVRGLYMGDGVYNQSTFDDQLVAVGFKEDNRMEISGSSFPAFFATDEYVGYRKSDTEYTVFAKVAEPNSGNVTVAFPTGEITVVAEIQIDNTTKRTLTFTGVKQE